MDPDLLARRFEAHRPHLRAVAYRMLGSLGEADDAVQEAWLRLSRADAAAVENLGGWLTTVVARICLNQLRTRERRREEPLGPFVPDPVVAAGPDPEQEALLADAVGLALLVVLQTLGPAERLAFVLHDMFAIPFEEIAPMVGRTPAATRQLASRARRRVADGAPVPDRDLARQQAAVDAFLAAAREGDFERLVATLAPDVVLRADAGRGAPFPSREVRGAQAVAREAQLFSRVAGVSGAPALVNGAVGAVSWRDGRPFSVLGFTVTDGRIAAIDILADPDRIARLDLRPPGA
jgi:RNA polymerase sigma-70 factor, ECF subfamily